LTSGHPHFFIVCCRPLFSALVHLFISVFSSAIAPLFFLDLCLFSPSLIHNHNPPSYSPFHPSPLYLLLRSLNHVVRLCLHLPTHMNSLSYPISLTHAVFQSIITPRSRPFLFVFCFSVQFSSLTLSYYHNRSFCYYSLV
jgi:hypothetical protein